MRGSCSHEILTSYVASHEFGFFGCIDLTDKMVMHVQNRNRNGELSWSLVLSRVVAFTSPLGFRIYESNSSMAGGEVEALRPPPPSQTDTIERSRSKLPKRSIGQNDKAKSIKEKCVKKKDDKDRKKRDRGSEGDGDHFFDTRRAQLEKLTKALSRAPGYTELDSCFRIGPDVVYNYVECTPLPLWFCEETPLVKLDQLMEKDSEEIVPMTPRQSKQLEVGLFQASAGDSSPMSWSANLTALEEEEFKEEGPFIDNVKIAHTLPIEAEEDNKHAIHAVKGPQKDGKILTKERVRVILTETDTCFLLMEPGKLVTTTDTEMYAKTQARNARYQKLCEATQASDSYVDRSSQTFVERERDKSTQANGIGVVDSGEFCTKHIMFDEFNRVREMETRKRIKDEEDALLKAIADREREEMHEEKKTSSGSEDSDSDGDEGKVLSSVDWVRLEEEEREEEVEPPLDISDDEFEIESDNEFELEPELDDLYRMRQEREAETVPKLLPDIKLQLALLDGLINANMEAKHTDNPFKIFNRRITSQKQ